MITLKINNYNDEDVNNLRSILEYSIDRLYEVYSCDKNCEHCDAETVCSDLRRTIKYLENVRRNKRG